MTDGTTAVSNGTLTIGEVYDRAHASVVEIRVTTATSSGPVAPGSGTSQARARALSRRDGHIVTNAHVVEGGSPSPYVLERQDLRRDARRDRPVQRYRRPEGRPRRARWSRCSSATPRTSGSATPWSRSAARSDSRAGSPPDRQRARPLDRGPERLHDRRLDPDRRGINHGNSGGPLLDSERSSVVGVNAQIASDRAATTASASRSRRHRGVDGEAADRRGSVQHAYLGVSVTEPSGDAARGAGGRGAERQPGRGRRASRSATSIASVDGKGGHYDRGAAGRGRREAATVTR